MSTYDWKKELKASAIDGVLFTIGIFGLAWIGSKMSIPKPSLDPSGKSIGKFIIYAGITDASIAYMKEQKWINP
jgi:xanthine/uracil/vitamin C permease (AzgA family)